MEGTIFYGALIFIVSVLLLMFIMMRKANKGKFRHIMDRRMSRIDRKKLGIMYLKVLGFFLLCYAGNSDKLHWYDYFAFSVVFMVLILVVGISNLEVNKDEETYLEENTKRWERDEKIKKIIGR